MTNKNMNWSGRKASPFILKPVGKNYLWGGRRLREEFGKDIAMTPLAETWECSTHPDGPSIVSSGEFTGQTLDRVIKEHPEFLGRYATATGQLPIIVKLIDAKENLSVQVHPDDDYANIHENGQLGKSEMWYVLDASPDAHLVYGLWQDLDKDQMRSYIADGSIEKYLQKVNIHKDDVFYIEAGTIHAIGAGALVAEIQENSNLTYRLYDYNRIDKNGKKRQLHIERALEVASLEKMSKPKQPMRVLRYGKGCARELLCRCKYFEVCRMIVNTEHNRELVSYYADQTSFRVLFCISGCGTILMDQELPLHFFKGDCIFFPANSKEVRIHGYAQFLDVKG